ncbi:MAG: hypothetical protein AB7H93_15070 [Vicinamibacterales bacterium]
MKYRRIEIEGEALVVAFDMCSSTTLIEELTLAGALRRYDRLVTDVKEHLAQAQADVLFDPYKFNGDGWILLFPSDTDGSQLFDLLRKLCIFYQDALETRVLRHLAARPSVTGLTFGIDSGPLHAMKIYGQREYVGRAINVACRLQGAIKDNDSSPAYKALVSNSVYNDYLRASSKLVKVYKVERRLRNIRSGSGFGCKKIELLNLRAT